MSITNLHDPSSAPRPPAASSAQPQPTLHSEVQRLTQLKDDINASLEVYFGVLTTVSSSGLRRAFMSSQLTCAALQQNKVTMQTPLIDPQGFPRSDIDVAGVRTARMQIIRLRNDLQGVQGEMEKLVERGLPRGEEGAPEEEGDAVMREGAANGVQQEEKPFARIDGVFPGSPADSAVCVLPPRACDSVELTFLVLRSRFALYCTISPLHTSRASYARTSSSPSLTSIRRTTTPSEQLANS